MARSAIQGRALMFNAKGFTLVEMAIALVIIALLLVFFMGATPALLNSQKISLSESRLLAVETALTQYAMQNKRLPCPADGTNPSDAANAGTEIARDANGDCTTQTSGVVPWAALGLTAANIEDGWGTRLTYRVALGLTRNNALDMSGCDTAGSTAAVGAPPNQSCAPLCTASTLTTACTPPSAFLAGKGFTIRDQVAGNILMDPAATPSNGAAFVVISHGENRSGGYSSTGTILTATGPQEGTNEAPNRADQGLAVGYIDAPKQFGNTTAHFDDYVVRPSVMTVINRALLGPRVHY